MTQSDSKTGTESSDEPQVVTNGDVVTQEDGNADRSATASVTSIEPGSSPEDSTRLEKAKAQIEYYFSEDNLKTDDFFQRKMAENNGWLDFKWLLGCNKLKKLQCDERDVSAALTGHLSLTTMQDKETGSWWVRTSTPLPDLIPHEERTPKKRRLQDESQQLSEAQLKKRKKRDNAVETVHNPNHKAGCLAVVEGIPEEVSDWRTVKSAVQDKLNDHPNCIRFVSEIDQNGSCYVAFRSFPDDIQLVEKLLVPVEGQEVAVSLLKAGDARLKKAYSSLPSCLRKSRSRGPAKANQVPMKIGGESFDSVAHLKDCVNQLLDVSPVDEDLPETATSVIKRLFLGYRRTKGHSPRTLKDILASATETNPTITCIRVRNRECKPSWVGSEDEGTRKHVRVRKAFMVVQQSDDGQEIEEVFPHWQYLKNLSAIYALMPAFFQAPADAGQEAQEVNKGTEATVTSESASVSA